MNDQPPKLSWFRYRAKRKNEHSVLSTDWAYTEAENKETAEAVAKRYYRYFCSIEDGFAGYELEAITYPPVAFIEEQIRIALSILTHGKTLHEKYLGIYKAIQDEEVKSQMKLTAPDQTSSS